jgi:hypothetical protein
MKKHILFSKGNEIAGFFRFVGIYRFTNVIMKGSQGVLLGQGKAEAETYDRNLT